MGHELIHIPSQNLRVGDAGRSRHHHVDLAAHVLRDLARSSLKLSKHGLTLVEEGTELGTSWLVGISEDEGLASGNVGSSTSKRDGGEGLDVEVGALRAGLDELGSEREDGAGTKGRVKSVGNWHGLGSGANERLVTSFDCNDLSGSSKNCWHLDKRSSTEVAYSS